MCAAARLALAVPAIVVMLALGDPPRDARTLDPAVLKAVVETYARLVHLRYTQTVDAAEAMRGKVRTFVAEPTSKGLEDARAAWTVARQVYGRTEVFRFYGGPIDSRRGGVETLINAWPIDEAYIDSVEGDPAAGIINNPAKFPTIDKSILALLNQRSGETNVATGWHAIEFLLWGQDRSETTPGVRSYTDYVPDGTNHADRRAQYLTQVTDLLLTHLASLRDAWAPNVADNYRAGFVRDTSASLQNILEGMTILSGFEMSGERMIVAYETRDQEEEHSCFSDTTHLDLIANMQGIAEVYRGGNDPAQAPGIREIALAVDPLLVNQLDQAMTASLEALQSIPPPFDQAIRAVDDASAARRSIRTSFESLERQAELLAELAQRLGYDIPLAPPG